MMDMKATSIAYFIFNSSTGPKIDDCDMLCFPGLVNGAIADMGGYLNKFVRAEATNLVRSRFGSVISSVFCTEYQLYGLAPTSDEVFIGKGFLDYDNWRQQIVQPNYKLGVVPATGGYTGRMLTAGVGGTANISTRVTNESEQPQIKKPIINGLDGSICAGPCGNFVPYAEPNQSNNTYICFNCR